MLLGNCGLLLLRFASGLPPSSSPIVLVSIAIFFVVSVGVGFVVVVVVVVSSSLLRAPRLL